MMLSLLIPKLVLGAGLISVIVFALRAPAPRRQPQRMELRLVAVAGLGLYLVGAAASVTGHGILSALVLASGICVSSVAVWLSRGSGADDPPIAGELPDSPPPPPDPLGPIDWDAFERELAEHARPREPAGVR